jgi:SAM-dependent methyltransferase
MRHSDSYLMENDEEAFRLEIKTDPEAVREEADWCGISPGMRVLDAGCGPGKVTSILHKSIQPDGSILGVDYSRERVDLAKKSYSRKSGIDFRVHDLRDPLKDVGLFDLIWVRFVLEYHRTESVNIVKNLTACLKPGGSLCLIDLDYNCMTHYEMPPEMERILFQIVDVMQRKYDFDPYTGRKLYSYLYDLGYEDIRMDLKAHHLIYGKVKAPDLFNWTKKLEMASRKASNTFDRYPGGHKKFFVDFTRFFNDPRRFTYTPLILCKGTRPV